ncbi:hypothetical protein ABTY20_17240 [Streptomyces sp. NPDC126497]|uniref:hypothetical protein n=1 Tax=Streptomyces sp. NPDC126497 TaxID=3155313 RepID=UPI003327A499
MSRESVLYLLLVLAPFLAPFVVLGAAVELVRRARAGLPGSGWRRPGVTTCVLVAVLAGAAALGAHAWGVMSGFYVLDPDQLCAGRGAPGDRIVTRETPPVSVRCVTPDGRGTELVPGWVNPVVFTGLALCALALGTGALTVVRRVLRR